MTLELKLKLAALNAAVDITLKRIEKSPERCARNLIELGLAAYPNRLPKSERDAFQQKLLMLCKSADCRKAKDAFFKVFANIE